MQAGRASIIPPTSSMSGPDEQQLPAPAAAPVAADPQRQGQQQDEAALAEAEAVRAVKRLKVEQRAEEAEGEESLGDEKEEEEEEEEEEDDDDDDDDDDKDQEPERPAADVITLRLLGSGSSSSSSWAFVPEFTHQLFEGEEVPPGYPGLRVELGIDARTAAWTVDVTYDEAAGRAEKAAIQAEEREQEAVGGAVAANEPLSNTPPTEVLSSNGGDDAALLRCLMPAVPPVEGAACTINGRAGRLYAEKGFMPDGETQQKQQGEEEDEPVAVLPFGDEVEAYSVGGNEFAILHALPSCLHDHHTTMGPQQQEQELQCRAVANFHRRVQKLAPWFIENGDDVDPQAGEWELLYLVQRPASAQQQQQEQEQGQGADGDKKSVVLVGYLTTYAFNNPLKGKGLRVCQALVLPPFQRQGHGQRLLRAAYALARARDVVFEVTVEDPCPGFAALRAVIDTEDVRALCKADPTVLGEFLADSQRFDCLEKPHVARVQAALKLTKKQVILAYETLKLRQAPKDGDAALHTKYRLMIKRRRAREVQGDYMGRKPEMQAHLEKFYRERLAECAEILRRAKLPPEGTGASE